MDIILKSELLTISGIKRKTKAQMFKNLLVGDVVEFSVPIKRARTNRGTYATYIEAKNVKTGEVTHSSFNQLPIVLDAFELAPTDYKIARNEGGNVYITYSRKPGTEEPVMTKEKLDQLKESVARYVR